MSLETHALCRPVRGFAIAIRSTSNSSDSAAHFFVCCLRRPCAHCSRSMAVVSPPRTVSTFKHSPSLSCFLCAQPVQMRPCAPKAPTLFLGEAGFIEASKFGHEDMYSERSCPREIARGQWRGGLPHRRLVQVRGMASYGIAVTPRHFW